MLPLHSQAPIAWISPGAIAPQQRPPGDRFLFRVGEFCRNIQLSVRQDGRVIYSQRFRRLQPNQSARLGCGWLPAIDPNGGALQLTID
jgi:hypothetical protein